MGSSFLRIKKRRLAFYTRVVSVNEPKKKTDEIQPWSWDNFLTSEMRMACISDKEILLELRLKTILLSDVFEGRTDKYGSIKLQNLKILLFKNTWTFYHNRISCYGMIYMRFQPVQIPWRKLKISGAIYNLCCWYNRKREAVASLSEMNIKNVYKINHFKLEPDNIPRSVDRFTAQTRHINKTNS